MGKSILTEIKRAFKRKYTWWYLLGIVGLILIANIAVIGFRAIYGANEGTYAYNLLEYATWCFVIPYYTCILIADIGFGREYPNPHIKDGHTSGLGRSGIYISKLVSSLVVGAFFMVVAFVALIIITTLFQIKDGLVSWYSVQDFLGKAFIAVPLWFAGVSFGMMFLFSFNKKRFAIIAYIVMTLVIPRTIMLLAAEPYKIALFRFIRTYTLNQNFSLIPYLADPARNVPLTVTLGILYGVIATIIGCVIYSKKKFE